MTRLRLTPLSLAFAVSTAVKFVNESATRLNVGDTALVNSDSAAKSAGTPRSQGASPCKVQSVAECE